MKVTNREYIMTFRNYHNKFYSIKSSSGAISNQTMRATSPQKKFILFGASFASSFAPFSPSLSELHYEKCEIGNSQLSYNLFSAQSFIRLLLHWGGSRNTMKKTQQHAIGLTNGWCHIIQHTL